MDGSDAERLQGNLARVAFRSARIVGAAGAEPRVAVRRAEHQRRRERSRAAAVVLRPASVMMNRPLADRQLVRLEDSRDRFSEASSGALPPPYAYTRRQRQSDRMRLL